MKQRILSIITAMCMLFTLMPALSLSADAIGTSYFLITKASPSAGGTATSYYYVYAGVSSASLASFTTGADSDSGKAYSNLDLAITNITAAAASSATLHFAALGNADISPSGVLDIGDRSIKLYSGTYTIKGEINASLQLGTSLFYLFGASVIIDGATITSTEHGLYNEGNGSVTVNSGTINAGKIAITTATAYTGNITVNGGTISSSDSSGLAISYTGTGSVTINGGTITANGGSAITASGSGTKNVTVSGGLISASNGNALRLDGSINAVVSGGTITAAGTNDAIYCTATTNLSITGGKIYSQSACAVKFLAAGSLSISGSQWNDTTQTGTLLLSDANSFNEAALRTGGSVTNAEIKGGTISSSAGFAAYLSGNVTISSGLIKTASSSYPAMINIGTITITGGTVSNANQSLSVASNLSYAPGTILNIGTIYIGGGTISNTASAGYAVYNYSPSGQTCKIYLSGTPSITGNTAAISSHNAIYANDGSSTYYTGAPVKLFYSGAIAAGSTVAVSNVDSTLNSSLFSLKNDGYSLSLTGINLVIAQTVPTNTSTDSSSGYYVPTYYISASAGVGGSISPIGSIAVIEGNDKIFTIKANDGYRITDVLVDGKSVGTVSSYTFTKVAAGHTIKAEFAVIDGIPYYYGDNGGKVFIGFSSDSDGTMKYIAPKGVTVLFDKNKKEFSDIGGHWAKGYIDFVTEREILYGTAENVFSPDASVSRAMFASIIGRLYERSYLGIKAGEKAVFTDCDYSGWYGNYIDWCSENGIIKGRSGTIFDPDSSITREEAAVMLYRFAKFIGVSDKGTGGTELKFADAAEISAWANDAVLYCQNAGIIVGRGSEKFNPQSAATRAEISSMIARFVEAVV